MDVTTYKDRLSYYSRVTDVSLSIDELTNEFKVCIYSFFVVGDYAADKIGVGVPQCGHELGE